MPPPIIMIDLALLIQERGYSSRVLMSVNVKILICRKRRKRPLAQDAAGSAGRPPGGNDYAGKYRRMGHGQWRAASERQSVRRGESLPRFDALTPRRLHKTCPSWAKLVLTANNGTR